MSNTSTPALGVLSIETTCNTTDKELLRNLRHAKELALPRPEFSMHQTKTRPLIICGSGPSLRDYLPLVRAYWQDADIMALNGAYRELLDSGIVPTYYAQLDARAENVNFVEIVAPGTKFLLASQCHPDMFTRLAGEDVSTFHLLTPTCRKIFPDAEVYYGGGGTIGLTALALAAGLGYRTLGLVGYDSSYSNGKSHVRPQPQNEKLPTIDVWVENREYLTSVAMAEQVSKFRPWLRIIEGLFPDIDVRLFGSGLFYDYMMTCDNAVQPTRETEAAKYDEMYKDPHYRMSETRAEGIHYILGMNPARGSLIDVGAGRGETLRIARELGYGPVRGREVVRDLLTEDITYGMLPHVLGAANTVTCFEVIEHLLPEDVVPALRNLADMAFREVVISVCTAPDIRGGVDLHPSARSEEAWMETMREAWGADANIVKVGQLSAIGVSPAYRYTKCRTS